MHRQGKMFINREWPCLRRLESNKEIVVVEVRIKKNLTIITTLATYTVAILQRTKVRTKKYWFQLEVVVVLQGETKLIVLRKIKEVR